MAKKLFTSPRGLAVFPWLNKPDTKFKAEGQYKVGLKLKTDDKLTQKFIAEIDAGMAQAVATARTDNPAKAKKINQCADKPYRAEVDDDDNETGFTIFNFKMTASGTSRKTGKPFTLKPALFDAAGEPLDAETRIGGGSLIRVSYLLNEFFQTTKIGAGVSLQLNGVKVIKLVEWGGGDASAHGFAEDESDFEDSEAETAEDEDEEEEEAPPPVKKGKKAAAKKAAPAPVAEADDEDEDEEEEDEDF
jgi:ssDNA-binding protein